MSWTQTWFIDKQMYPPVECLRERIHNEHPPPLSLAFFCPQCGDIWARRVITPATPWNVLTRECRKHKAPRYCEPEGSVWIAYNTEYVKNLPKSVLRYETLLRLESEK